MKRSTTDSRHCLVTRDELACGLKGPGGRILSGLLMRTLAVGRANDLYDKTYDRGEQCAEALLQELEVHCRIDPVSLANIPTEGPLIVISNHPTGALDGVVLIETLRRVRRDVKFMGNYLLCRIESLAPYFIPVDPFENRPQGRNVHGMKAAIGHLRAGGVLVIFPAGEVATWQHGCRTVRDKEWSKTIMKFIRRCDVPVLPLCIDASNSLLFHLAGRVHPMLRTALLPREFINKRGQTVNIRIGAPLTPKRLEELQELSAYSDYLRANVEYMLAAGKKPARKHRLKKKSGACAREIAARRPLKEIIRELNKLRQTNLLFSYGNYEVFFAPPEAIPNMMHEIGRMREITFRGVGEGTMQPIDTDEYDRYYHQLFVWDVALNQVVGAYRMGMGREIVPRYGIRGFYTYSLFRYQKRLAPLLEQSIELGRSFISSEYQRKAVSLMLLWKGILYVLLKHEGYRNLLGPVTISGEFDDVSKTVLLHYLRTHCMDDALSRSVKPVTGPKGIQAAIETGLIRHVNSIELIGKLVSDIERDERSVPVLIKKYLQVNSHVLGFNVDHAFCDALDALMLLDLKRVPENTIAMLSKELTDIDVVGRFKNI